LVKWVQYRCRIQFLIRSYKNSKLVNKIWVNWILSINLHKKAALQIKIKDVPTLIGRNTLGTCATSAITKKANWRKQPCVNILTDLITPMACAKNATYRFIIRRENKNSARRNKLIRWYSSNSSKIPRIRTIFRTVQKKNVIKRIIMLS